jgi:hypothetical protein
VREAQRFEPDQLAFEHRSHPDMASASSRKT